MITPIEKIDFFYLKRDDYFKFNNVCGGKVRSALEICKCTKNGLVTAGSRFSPQIQIISEIAKYKNLSFNAHCPSGDLTNELIYAKSNGANIIQHKYGYNNLIIKKAKEDAIKNNYLYIPFGMECKESIIQNKEQVQNIPKEVKRIIISVGSGITLSGVLHGLLEYHLQHINVIGIIIGANPIKRLDKWAPKNWRNMVNLININIDYHKRITNNNFHGILLDEIYEAKCIEWLNNNLRENDLFWIIGKRT